MEVKTFGEQEHLEKAMEAFIADEKAISFGFVYSHLIPPTGMEPSKTRVIISVHNVEKHPLLTTRLLEIANRTGLTAETIADLINILTRKGFHLYAQNEDAQSYIRTRKIDLLSSPV